MSTAPTERVDLRFDLVDRLHKSLRVSRKTAGRIAEDLDTHRNTVANYLSGRSQPKRETLAGWALATGVPLRWLESGDMGPSGGPDGSSGQLSTASVGAIRAGISQVIGRDVDMITFALVAEALGGHDDEMLAKNGFTAWIIATASGFDAKARGLSQFVPAYIDEDRLASDLRKAVDECTRRDSNPKPSDPRLAAPVVELFPLLTLPDRVAS